jgi:hypothetical protein
MLFDTELYRLWPIEAAVRARKPILCCASLNSDEAHADALNQQVQQSGVPVLMGLLPRFARALTDLGARVAAEKVSPNCLDCLWRRPFPFATPPSKSRHGFFGAAGVVVIDSCLSVLAIDPVRAFAAREQPAGYQTLSLQAADGRELRIICEHILRRHSGLELRIQLGDGLARAVYPRRFVQVTSDCRRTVVHFAPCPIQALLQHFHHVARGEECPTPDLAAAHRALVCLRAAEESARVGHMVPVPTS